MKTILVSGASGVVGYGILKSLRKANKNYNLIGTSIYDDSIAPAFCDIFVKAPHTDSEDYIDWLIQTVKSHNVDLIIPGIEADMLKWDKEREKLESSGVSALLNTSSLIRLCSDKWNFYRELKKTQSEYLIESSVEGTFDELMQKYGVPFLLKPRRGFASKGIVIVDSESTFNGHQKSLGSMLMAQRIVGNKDEEYTVSGFFDKDSELICYMTLKRKLASEGYTEKAEVAELPTVEAALKKLANILKPVGPTNFQFRIEDGQLRLLEINPRISSATSIRTEFGYNESLMSVLYFLEDIKPIQPEIKTGYAVRYIEEHIF